MASYSYRTATTTYPCYVPVLGDSVGAGRMRLAIAKIQLDSNITRIKHFVLIKSIQIKTKQMELENLLIISK